LPSSTKATTVSTTKAATVTVARVPAVTSTISPTVLPPRPPSSPSRLHLDDNRGCRFGPHDCHKEFVVWSCPEVANESPEIRE
jgi:hypothetical protein